MWRDLTDKEKEALFKRGCCPFCEGKELYAAARGGGSSNYECEGCGARFNLVPSPFEIGQLLSEPSKPYTKPTWWRKFLRRLAPQEVK